MHPRVFIIGGGFAGLAAARALASAPADVILVDRRNHHVFQPLLYQVATAALSPADIASPIRHILRDKKNCQVVLAEATGVDLKRRYINFANASVEYDYLVLAAGATHSYFGHGEWEAIAPGLKTLEDSIEIRRRILLAFETAEYEGSAERRRAALTFAIIGGGPTGVELAGAIKEIAAHSIPGDFRHIDTTTTRVLLFEGGDRLLSQFPPRLSTRAKRDLESLGVEVHLNTRVTDVSPDGVVIDEKFLPVGNVFWAAGVRGSPIAQSLAAPLAADGRVEVEKDLSLPAHPEVFVIGDLALVREQGREEPVPGVAQAALQMGTYVGRLITAELQHGPAPRKPFHYVDKGTLATVGRARAVAVIGGIQFTGLVAWLLWAFVHILFLIGFRNRVSVAITWVWNWFVFARDARLITGDAQLAVVKPRDDPRLVPWNGDADSASGDKQLPDAAPKPWTG